MQAETFGVACRGKEKKEKKKTNAIKEQKDNSEEEDNAMKQKMSWIFTIDFFISWDSSFVTWLNLSPLVLTILPSR